MCPRLARRLALPVVAWHNGRVRSGAQLAAWRREEARRGRRSGEVRLMRPASWDRDREILRLRRSGVSCRAVARRVGCALATVASAADRLQRRAGVRGTIVGSVANPIRRDKQRRNPLADRPATRARGAADGAAVGRASADPRPDQSAATGTARRSGRMDSYGGMAGRRSERSARAACSAVTSRQAAPGRPCVAVERWRAAGRSGWTGGPSQVGSGAPSHSLRWSVSVGRSGCGVVPLAS